ncbi:MAG: LTA synthase family protein [Saprospiraceae bacterium]|nr:LTA synthase family protein [Saprospiraceae bacterium]
MTRLFRLDFSSGLRWIVLLYLVMIGILTSVRFLFYFVFKGEHLRFVSFWEILEAFITGFRFDSMVSCYILSLPLVLLILSRLFPNEKVLGSFFRQFICIYSPVMICLMIFVCLMDLYYYAYFQNHINILFFGIVDDDTKAVLKGIWNDYPVFGICIGFIVLYWILFKLVIKICQLNDSFPKMFVLYEYFSFIVFIGFFVLGMRGSLSLFTLNFENSVISENSFVNDLGMNGIFALKNAFSEKRKQTITTNYRQTLEKYKYDNPSTAIGDYLGKDVGTDLNPDLLLSRSPYDSLLEIDPPNVVFVQMESFSNYYLDLHSDSFNLLGRLEDQLPFCIVFRNFLSATGGTIHSLEALLTGSPLTPISQSTFMDCPLKSSVAKIYSTAGYRTSFITSGALGWRNMNKFTKYQGFDLSEGSEILLKKIPGTQICDWGVFDESMFTRALEILNHKVGSKPQFIYLLTTTNHPPFQRPSHYKLFPLHPSDSLTSKFKVSTKLAMENFGNYQYANDCLGAFLASIRNSPLGQNTIVAASGDHNTLQVFNFEDSRLHSKHSVPFILYIPERYRKYKFVNTSVFGSHKDVFPTLFSNSLSKAVYLNSGVNLLDSAQAINNFAIINYNLSMNHSGIVKFEQEPIYYQWTEPESKMNKKAEINQELKHLLLLSRAYSASMSYFIQTEFLKCSK